MTVRKDYLTTFERLRNVLKKHESHLLVLADKSDSYYLNVPFQYKKNQQFFGAVQIKKNYVSYYLMPVYVFPDLLSGMSVELKKRMQGKSCFSFKTIDAGLLKELTRLTKRAFDRFKQEGLV